MRTWLIVVVQIAVLTFSCGKVAATVETPKETSWIRTYEPLKLASVVSIQPSRGDHSVMLVRGGPVTVLVEIDANGEVIQSRKVDLPASVLATNRAGEIFLAASRQDTDDSVITTVWKLGSDYRLAWSRSYRVTLGHGIDMTTILAMGDGGVVVTMTSELSSGIVRIGSQGSVLWSKRYERSGGEKIRATALTKTGDILVAGKSQGVGWLARLTSGGELRWQKHQQQEWSFTSVIEDRDGNIVAVSERFAVLKTDAAGKGLWAKECDDCGTRLNYGRQVLQQPDGSYLVTGSTSGSRRVLLRLAPDGTIRSQVALTAGKRGIGIPQFAAAAEAIVRGREIVFAPPLQRRIPGDGFVVVLSFDPARPPAACAWFTNPGIRLKDVSTAADVITLEEFPLPVEANDAGAVVDTHHVSALVTNCDEAPETSETLWTPAGPAAQVSTFVHDVEKPNRAAWLKLLQQREFEKLDAIAAQLLREKHGQDPTRWRISHFYRGVVDLDFSETERLPLLKAWMAARPSSNFAALSYARGLQMAASNRRGGGYADTVTESGWKEFEALMKQSAAIIDAHRVNEDPQWWLMKIVAANALGTGDVRAIAKEATRYVDEPLVFNTAATFTIPRWGGSEEEFVEFIGDIADLTRKTHGDAMYFYLAYQLIFVEDVFALRRYPFDRARLRKGGADMIALNPKWTTAYHRVAKLAHSLEDKETAVEMFARPELAWYSDATGVWTERVYYDIARQWALGITDDSRVGIGAVPPQTSARPAPGPFLVPQFKGLPSEWPQIVMPVESIVDGRKQRHVAFVAKTLSGKVVVTALPYDRARTPENFVTKSAQMSSKLRAPSGWIQVAGVEGRDPIPDQLGVRLRLADAAIPGVPALDAKPVGRGPLSGMMRVMVIGCVFVGDECRQKVVEGWIGASTQRDGAIRTQYVQVRDPFDIDGFTGAPVIDEEGKVILVAKRSTLLGSQPRPPNTMETIVTEDLDHVIDRW